MLTTSKMVQTQDANLIAGASPFRDTKDLFYSLLIASALAIIMCSIWFVWQERTGTNLGDEGFLWYGVERTVAGDVPQRDFDAYEPGRYYWDAAIAMALRHHGLFELRLANMAFAAIGIFSAMLAIRIVSRSWWFIAGCGVILIFWLFPRHKVFEHSIAMIGVLFATLLLQKPTVARHVAAGVFVGVAGTFGRNMGLYTLVSFGALIAFIALRIDRYRIFARVIGYALGIAVGALPLLLMYLLIPGYFHGVWQEVLQMFHGAPAQLPLPIPWPWRLHGLGGGLIDRAFPIGVSLEFILVPVLFGGCFVWAMLIPKKGIGDRSLIIASAFVGVTFLHHAFSRPDFGHLAQSIDPALLCVAGIIALAFKQDRKIRASLVAIILVGFTFATAAYMRPSASLASQESSLKIDGHTFKISADQKLVLTTLRERYETIGPGEGLVAAPLYPFAYAFLHARCPWHDSYLLFHADTDLQEMMIRQLKQNRVVLIMASADVEVDGRDDLRFPNTHPIVWKYILDHYQLMPGPVLPDNLQFWRLKSELP